MPGPKMGPRPADFNEEIVKQSPSYLKWQQLETGQKMKYACREFTKGQANDEERLMRRIMIARRNNVKDHETLKRARQSLGGGGDEEKQTKSNNKKQRPNPPPPDEQIAKEMDEPAVVATRSYKAWLELPDGVEFLYNQKYIKGKEGHDWLLRKNIWRRMRYRRENKKLLQKMGARRPDSATVASKSRAKVESARTGSSASGLVVDHALLPDEDDDEAYDQKASSSAAAAPADMDSTALESALAAGESYVKAELGMAPVHNPLEAAATSEALDAAAKLAAATASQMEGRDERTIEEV